MRHLFYQFKSGLKDTAGLSSIFFLRLVESQLSPRTFYAVLAPFYWVRAAVNVVCKKPKTVNLPEFLSAPKTLHDRIRARREIYLNHLLQQFQDRLGSVKWRANCRIEGLEQLKAAQRHGQPVILAFAHIGPFYLIHYWLRAAGFPVVGFVGGASTSRSRLMRFQDRSRAQPAIPVALYQDQLRDVAGFLAAGNHLLIAIDIPTGRQMEVALGEGWNWQLATGALRLAGRYHATVIPCTITSSGRWQFHLRLGQPLPPELLANETDYTPAGNFLLAEILPVLRAHPQQCSPDLLRSLKPTAEVPTVTKAARD